MGRKTIIIIAIAVVFIAALAVAGAYAYDRSQDGKIANGVPIAETGHRGAYLGRIDLTLDRGGVRRGLPQPARRGDVELSAGDQHRAALTEGDEGVDDHGVAPAVFSRAHGPHGEAAAAEPLVWEPTYTVKGYLA